MIRGLLGLPGFVWARLALIGVVIYTLVWPQKAVTGTAVFGFLILRGGRL